MGTERTNPGGQPSHRLRLRICTEAWLEATWPALQSAMEKEGPSIVWTLNVAIRSQPNAGVPPTVLALRLEVSVWRNKVTPFSTFLSRCEPKAEESSGGILLKPPCYLLFNPASICLQFLSSLSISPTVRQGTARAPCPPAERSLGYILSLWGLLPVTGVGVGFYFLRQGFSV